MNRILPLLLCCLLLCGCSLNPSLVFSTDPSPTESPIPSSSQNVQPIALLQTQYDGAFKTFSPGIQDAAGLYAMGDDLLILSGRENTTLTLLSGDTLVPLASLTLSFLLEPEDPSLRLGDGYLSYFDPIKKETLVLDSALREVSHIPGPEGLQGVPILSEDRNALYYCTSNGVRVWNLETGIRRQLKEMAFPGQALTGLKLRDSVLVCTVPEGNQNRTLFLSSQTGGLLYETQGDMRLTGQDGWYCAVLPLGLEQALICGESPDFPMLFLPEDDPDQCFLLSDSPGVVTCTNQENACLTYYDLLSGKPTSSLTLEPGMTPVSSANTPDGILFILAQGDDRSGLLYRWEISPHNAPALRENTVCLVPWQTSGDTDPSALARCDAYASELGRKWGIHILTGNDAVQVQPWDFRLEPETQPGLLLRELQNLEKRLSQFPDSFLSETASHFTSVNLCIVRGITGTAESGNQEPATGVQFQNGTDAYVVITAGKYGEQALYHELFHVMETHILTNSSALDQWSRLNPQGFTYTYGVSNGDSPSEDLLSGENQAFLDAYSLTFPKEDRSRIFETALLPGNKETFRPWMLQRKLTAICRGIREAYGLSKSPETYPWEQYLDVSLAYKE